MIHHSREYVSTAPVAVCLAPLHPTLFIALGDVRPGCSCSSMETYSMKPSMHILELIWRSHKIWRYVSTDSVESWLLCTVCLSMCWPRSDFMWPVVYNCLHFAIIPLTIDSGIFSREEISQMDLLNRWQLITVLRLNSWSSYEWPILLQMFVEPVGMFRCSIWSTCGHEGDWNTWVQRFGYLY